MMRKHEMAGSNTTLIESMTRRRVSCPQVTQQLWDAIKAVRNQRGLPTKDKVQKVMQKQFGVTEEEVTRQLNHCVRDGLIEVTKRTVSKGNKAGSEQEWYKLPTVKLKTDEYDWYCFDCHSAGDVICCSRPGCQKVYHMACISQYEPQQGSFKCHVCKMCEPSPTKFQMKRSKMNRLLAYCLQKLKSRYPLCLRDQRLPPPNKNVLVSDRVAQALTPPLVVASQDDNEAWRTYLLIARDMNLTYVEDKIDRHRYRLLEEFHADCLNIVHNMVIYNGVDSAIADIARQMLRDCIEDLNEIRQCADCFKLSHGEKKKLWFCRPCRKPHELVYAKQQGMPYWPAKVVKVEGDQYDVKLFGAPHTRLMVPKAHIRPISVNIHTLQVKRSSAWNRACEELKKHQELLEKFRVETREFTTFVESSSSSESEAMDSETERRLEKDYRTSRVMSFIDKQAAETLKLKQKVKRRRSSVSGPVVTERKRGRPRLSDAATTGASTGGKPALKPGRKRKEIYASSDSLDSFHVPNDNAPKKNTDEIFDELLKSEPANSGRKTPFGGRKTPSVASGRKTPFVASGRKTPSVSSGRKTPSVASGRKTPSLASGRNTPSVASGRKTPSDASGRKTPSVASGRKTPSVASGRNTPSVASGRKTPSVASGRKTPSIASGRETPSVASGRKTPSVASGRKTPSVASGRNTPSVASGRKTPSVASGRKTPSVDKGRKTPAIVDGGRKTPSIVSGRKTPSVASGRRTPSILDGRKTPSVVEANKKKSVEPPKTPRKITARSKGSIDKKEELSESSKTKSDTLDSSTMSSVDTESTLRRQRIQTPFPAKNKVYTSTDDSSDDSDPDSSSSRLRRPPSRRTLATPKSKKSVVNNKSKLIASDEDTTTTETDSDISKRVSGVANNVAESSSSSSDSEDNSKLKPKLPTRRRAVSVTPAPKPPPTPAKKTAKAVVSDSEDFEVKAKDSSESTDVETPPPQRRTPARSASVRGRPRVVPEKRELPQRTSQRNLKKSDKKPEEVKPAKKLTQELVDDESTDSEAPLSTKTAKKGVQDILKKYNIAEDSRQNDSTDTDTTKSQQGAKLVSESDSEPKTKTQPLEEKVQNAKKLKNTPEKNSRVRKKSNEELKEKEETIVSSSSQEPITRSIAVQTAAFMPTIPPDLKHRADRISELEKELQVQAQKNRILEMDFDKAKVMVERMRSEHEDEIAELNTRHRMQISEVKRKQWCFNCELEAIYHCCWNTAYCSVECQQAHWQSEHKRVCRRKR